MRRYVFLAAAVALAAALLISPAAGVHAATTGQRILLEGDSITAGTVLAEPEDRLDARLATDLAVDPARITNHGVSGRTLAQLAAVWDADVATLSSGDVLVVDIGANDLPAYPGDTVWQGTYTAMVSRATAHGVHVLVGQITPMGSTYASQETLRLRLNAWLSTTFGADVLPYQQVLEVNPATTWIAWQDKADEVHPDGQGTGLMAHMLAAHLQAASWWQG